MPRGAASLRIAKRKFCKSLIEPCGAFDLELDLWLSRLFLLHERPVETFITCPRVFGPAVAN